MGLSEDAIASFATVGDAAKAIVPVLEPKDLVLVKASRAEGLDAFVREVLA
jgi:UDP-N-acetylmuramoyl-tripeptide--D-alanyl-D-alanine ligase